MNDQEHKLRRLYSNHDKIPQVVIECTKRPHRERSTLCSFSSRIIRSFFLGLLATKSLTCLREDSCLSTPLHSNDRDYSWVSGVTIPPCLTHGYTKDPNPSRSKDTGSKVASRTGSDRQTTHYFLTVLSLHCKPDIKMELTRFTGVIPAGSDSLETLPR